MLLITAGCFGAYAQNTLFDDIIVPDAECIVDSAYAYVLDNKSMQFTYGYTKSLWLDIISYGYTNLALASNFAVYKTEGLIKSDEQPIRFSRAPMSRVTLQAALPITIDTLPSKHKIFCAFLGLCFIGGTWLFLRRKICAGF